MPRFSFSAALAMQRLVSIVAIGGTAAWPVTEDVPLQRWNQEIAVVRVDNVAEVGFIAIVARAYIQHACQQ